jgi:hypothetical protein
VCGIGDAARCVDLRSDAFSCGTCDHACDTGQACLAGRCVETCEGAGGTVCDGICVDLSSDNENCRECGHACPAGTACHRGDCETSCPAGQILCNGSCLDANDPQNCGACGNVCATGVCREGVCAAAACEGTIGLPGRPLPPPSTAVSQSFSRALADLDGDGVLDFVIPRESDDIVEIRFVREHGQFGPPVNIAVGDRPSAAAVGDVDGDGRVDVVSCSAGGTGSISLLRNRGDGTFDRTDFQTNGPVNQCALGDLDGDGHPDLVLSYARDARIAVAHNTGGAFATPTTYPSGKPSPSFVAIADLDHDGAADVVMLNTPNGTATNAPDIDKGSVSVYPGRGDGTLGAPVTYAAGGFPLSLVVADLDGDGWLDVATGSFDEESVSILLNDGHGGLQPRRSVPLGNHPISLAAGDLDGNGSLDLVVNRFYDDVAILRNDGLAGFSAPEVYAVDTTEVALADANGDGALDLFVASGRPHVVIQEAGRLLAPTPIPVGDIDSHVALADLNGDGRPDAVVSSGADSLVGVLDSRVDGGFDPPRYMGSTSGGNATVGDIDGDGDIDLVNGGHGVGVQRNRGGGIFGPPEPIAALSNDFGLQPTLADLDGDGDLDLVVTRDSESPGWMQVFWNDGNGNFQPGPQFTTGWDSRSAAVGRITGGIQPDIVVPNWMDGTVSIFQGHADHSFTRYATLPVPAHSDVVLIADVTQDGRPDLIVTGSGELSATSWVVRIYPGLDHGLGAAIDVPAGIFPQALALVDLDSDGRRDLVVVGGGEIAFHRAWPGGGLASPVIYASSSSGGVAARDLTGDLRPDLITVGGPGALTTEVNRCLAP